jgi:hypothetical protein
MSNGRNFDQPAAYRVRITGTLDEQWSDWFAGFEIHAQANNETLLTGRVADQISLHGLLSRIRDLGLCLLCVQRVDAAKETDCPDDDPKESAP